MRAEPLAALITRSLSILFSKISFYGLYSQVLTFCNQRCVLKEHVAGGLYDQRDIDRFRTDDVFVRTYIRGPTRLDEGVDLVHESFRFRKEMEVNGEKS